ncbi:MerR family transcriptional regulator [Candidatus Methylopumilus planktonicus]|uniref:MerR family transcriptional regulator n=1 Tax=Candidatus Methylopumilus planktonicus TaxID=1581557 RepID=UPI003BEEFB80
MERKLKSPVLPEIPSKRYFAIGEVSELCLVKAHVLRYWEQEFDQLKDVKRRGNRRYYQLPEVLLIRKIRELLHDEGFTIQGAKQRLKDKSFVKEVKQSEPPKELLVTKQGQVELPLENLNQSNSLAGLNIKSIKDELLSIIDLLKK